MICKPEFIAKIKPRASPHSIYGRFFTFLPESPALLIILIAHIGHAFVGGLVAAAISRNAVMAVAMIVGVLTLIAGVINMMSMPLPTWMWIEVPLYLVAAWVAGRIVLGWRAGKHPGEDSNFRPAD